LTATTGRWSNSPTSYQYQWMRSRTSKRGFVAIAGQTDRTYRVREQDGGYYLRVCVRATNASGTSVLNCRARTGMVVPAIGQMPSIGGDAVVNKRLTLTRGTWTGAFSHQYRWQTRQGTGAWQPAANKANTGTTYTVGRSDLGKQLRVQVRGKNLGGWSAWFSSTALTVRSAVPVPQAGTATISGVRTVNGELTVPEGVWSGGIPAEYRYQWQRSDNGSTWSDIPGATARSYTPSMDDAGKWLRARVWAINAGGTSDALDTPAVLIATPPLYTTPPRITGALEQGATLRATSADWNGAVSIVRTWLRCESSGGGCVSTGIADPTYLLGTGDVGKTIRLREVATNTGGSTTVDSEPTGTIASVAAPVNSALPTVSGTPRVDATLAGARGTWSGRISGYTQQWQWSANPAAPNASWTDIPGATALNYVPAEADLGRFLRLRVTAIGPGGSTSATSLETNAVLEALPPQPPEAVDAPQILHLQAPSPPQEGTQLTADDGVWSNSPTLTRQWLRCTEAGTGCASIGVASRNYTPTVDDIGSTLRIRVTATNVAGVVTADSAATEVVRSKPPVNSAIPTITGTVRVGQELAAEYGTWSSSVPVGYGYEWQMCAAADCAAPEPAAGMGPDVQNTYTVAAGDAGKYLRVKVTATNEDGPNAVAYSEVTTLVPPHHGGALQVNGTPAVGGDVSAPLAGWVGASTYTFLWQICDTADCANPQAATSPGGNQAATYTVGSGDAGQYLRVRATATNAGGSTTVFSVIRMVTPLIDAAPTACATQPRVGQPCSGSAGTWLSAQAPTYSYQWQRSTQRTGGTWANISGATDATYTPVADDEAKYLRVVATATNAGGATSATSSATTAVLASVPTGPAVVRLPAIIGADVREGQVIQADNGEWINQVSLDRVWLRCNAGGGGCVSTGVTALSYSLTSLDVGSAMRLRVTATGSSGTQVVADSNPSIAVLPIAPANEGVPTISGQVQVGQVLSSAPGSWSSSTSVTFSYQWQACSTSACASPVNAGGTNTTSATYTAAPADSGRYLRLRVTATNAGGSTIAYSAATTMVPPYNSSAPQITSAVRVGQLATAGDGRWSGSSDISFSYEWQSCANSFCTAPQNAAGTPRINQSYTPTAADSGKYLRIKVTATNGEGAAAYAYSATAMVAPYNVAVPLPSGAAVVGSPFVGGNGSWSSAGSLSYAYQWQSCDDAACATPVNATGNGNKTATYSVAMADAGKWLRLRVTATNIGGASVAYMEPEMVAPYASVMPTSCPAPAANAECAGTRGTWVSAGPITYSDQWQVSANPNEGGWVAAQGTGATTLGYWPSVDDQNLYLRLQVTATNDGGSATAASDSGSATLPEAPANIALPSITGLAREGQTLTADYGSWTGQPTFQRLWLRCDGQGQSCVSTGLSGATYSLGGADIDATIVLRVTATNVSGSATADSAPTAAVVALPPSNAALPVISGSPRVGVQLSTTNGTWTSTPNPTFSYQWQACQAANCAVAENVGSNSAFFTPAAEHAGRYVRVRVTATNSGGSQTATAAITAMIPPYNATPITVNGDVRVGSNATLGGGAWSGQDTLAYLWQTCADAACTSPQTAAGNPTTGTSYRVVTADAGKYLRLRVTATNAGGATVESTTPVMVAPYLQTAPQTSGEARPEAGAITTSNGVWLSAAAPTFSYQWQVCEDANCASARPATSPSATSQAFTPSNADAGGYVRVRVTAANGGGDTVAYSNVVMVAPAATTIPTACAGPRTALECTSTPGEWISAASYTLAYRWQRSDGISGPWSDITGSSGAVAHYTPTTLDEGKFLRVMVTATSAGGSTPIPSNPTTVVLQTPPENDALPTLSVATPPAREGGSLSGTLGTWNTRLPNMTTPTLARQWLRCDAAGANCVEIAGATGAGYTLAAGDIAQTVRLRVTATTSAGSLAVQSAATAAILPIPPANTGALPSTCAAPRVTQACAASNGGWTSSVAITYSYQWQTNVSGTWTASTGSGATTDTYTPVPFDEGKTLRVLVTGANAGGQATATSAASAATVPMPPVNTALPTVAGDPRLGNTLTGSEGTWTISAVFYATTTALQWLRCDATGAGCTAIAGATTTTYVPTLTDVAATLRYRVTKANAGGTVSADSAVVLPKPYNTALPTIAGDPVPETQLSAAVGSWTAYETPAYTYQWQVSPNGNDSWAPATGAGATGAIYSVADADTTQYLRVIVRATVGGGWTEATSAATGMVAPSNGTRPSTTGTNAVGQVVTGNRGVWSGTGNNAGSFLYQWQVSDNGTSGWSNATGAGATTLGYTVAPADAGRYLRLRVAATNADGSAADRPASSPEQIRALGLASGTYFIRDGAMTAARSLLVEPTSMGAAAWARGFESPYAGAATVNHVGLGMPFTGFLVQRSDGFSRQSVTFTSRQVFNQTTGITADGGYASARKVMIGYAGGMGLYNSGQNVCSWGTAAGAIGSGWDGGTCGSWPDGLRWGTGNGANSTYDNRSGTWQVWLSWPARDVAHIQPSPATSMIVPHNTVIPVVTGSARPGAGTLATDNGTWLSVATIAYTQRWQRSSDGATGWVDIAGATGGSYQPPAGDEGAFVRSVVTASNNGGPAEAASAPVFIGSPVNATLPVISGTPKQFGTLTATPGTWRSWDTPSYAYQWQRQQQGASDWVDIAGATAASYTLTDDDYGYRMRVRVVATNVIGSSLPAAAAATDVVGTRLATTLPANPRDGQLVAIQTAAMAAKGIVWEFTFNAAAEGPDKWEFVGGSPFVVEVDSDEMLLPTTTTYAALSTAGPSIVFPLSGDYQVEAGFRGYPWGVNQTLYMGYDIGSQAASDATATVMDAVANLGSSTVARTRIVNDADVGSSLVAKYRHSSSSGAANFSRRTLSILPIRVAGVAARVTPVISGTLRVGSTISSSTGTWAGSPTTYAYQWQVAAAAAGPFADIPGATAASYGVAPADAGRYLRVLVTATSATNGTGIGISAATAMVPPHNTAAPALAGVPRVDEELTVSTGGWVGAPAEYSYSWESSADGITWAAAAGAGRSGPSYTIVRADAGRMLRATVNARNAGGWGVALTTSPTAMVPPVATALPVISGTRAADYLLTTTAGSWAGSPTNQEYRWQVSTDGMLWTDISGATTDSYRLLDADVDRYLRVQVRAANAGGFSPWVASAGEDDVVKESFIPRNTVAPEITGTTQEGHTLTAQEGTWVRAAPTEYAYDWYRCDRVGDNCASTGITTKTYVLGPSDGYGSLRVSVRARNAAGWSVQWSPRSAATAKIVFSTPPATVYSYAGSALPTGFIAADGSAVSRTVYQELFDVIGTTYGAGNGSTTFNVPDLRGRVAIGTGTDGSAQNGATRTRGEKGGDTRSQTHNHTGTTNWMDRNWNHSHSFEGPPGHTHGPWGGGDGVVFRLRVDAIHVGSYGRIWAVGTDTNHLHSFTTANTGAGGSENMKPFLGLTPMIKT